MKICLVLKSIMKKIKILRKMVFFYYEKYIQKSNIIKNNLLILNLFLASFIFFLYFLYLLILSNFLRSKHDRNI